MLGIPEGTLSSRLAMARKLLAARLSRYGILASVGAILARAEASVPAALIDSTLRVSMTDSLPRSIAALTQGALKSMFLSKLKLAAAVIAIVGLTAGTVGYGLVSSPIAAAPQDNKSTLNQKPADKPKPVDLKKGDLELLQGAWKVIEVATNGPKPRNANAMLFYFIKDKAYIGSSGKIEVSMTAALDTTASPKRIMFTTQRETEPMNCIYSLEGDKLKLAFPGQPGAKPPASFELVGENVIFDLQRDPNAKMPEIKQANDQAQLSAAHVRSSNNLKQILLALHNYHDQFGGFPGHAIADKNGNPLLSWRVAILPYIEQDALYRAFKLDEPWDSEHNKKLLPRMPKVFGDKGSKTHYRVLVGPGAAWEEGKRFKMVDFTDGTSSTIMLVEAADDDEWTKPEELAYSAKNPLPKLGGSPFEKGFHVGFADGHVKFLPLDTPESKLRAMITRNGGEKIEP